MRGHPGGAPGQQPGRVDVGGEVGERERDALVLDDRLPEGLAPDGVVAGELERGASDADRLGGHHRPGALERSQSGGATPLNGRSGAAFFGRGDRFLALLGLAAAGDALLEAVGAAEQVLAGHAAVLEHDLAGVRGAAAELVELAEHREAGGSLGTMNTPCPRCPASGSTVATTT